MSAYREWRTLRKWAYDEELKTWVYMEGAGRPYGSLYMAEWTPDGYYVNADGVWEPAR